MSDNIDFKCPPRMADGRHFTDYRPRCDRDVYLSQTLGAKDSFNYRMLLQRNATEIANAERAEVASRMKCAPCDAPVLRPYSKMAPLRD
jgi:hypothetical protein